MKKRFNVSTFQRSNGLTTLFVLWLFAVFAGFYLVQKPFTIGVALALSHRVLDILTAGWLVLLGLGLGHRLLQMLERFTVRTLERSNFLTLNLSTGEILILGSGLGLGALGLLTLGLGLAGLLYPWVFITLTLLLTLLLWPDFNALRRRLRQWPPLDAWPGRLTALYVVAIGYFTLIFALLPPADWDGLFYHLTAPKLFIQAHQISPGLDVPHFNFPFLAEMLFTYAMLLRGDIAAKLLHTAYGVLLTGLVFLTARRYFSRQSGWPAVLVLLSMPMIVTLASWAYNDLTLAFYQMAALYAYLQFTTCDLRSAQREPSALPPKALTPESQPSNPQPSNLQPSNPPASIFHLPPSNYWLILSGLFAGLAMGLKYTSFVCPLTIGLMIIWRASVDWRSATAGQRSPRLFVSSLLHLLLTFALPTLLVALPWYLKNFFFTGNPFYPFAYDLFGGIFWDRFRADWYGQGGSGIGFDLPTLVALPALLTLGVRDVNYFDGRTGPLFLAFLPLMILYGLFRYRARLPERPPALDVLLLFALAQFLFWTLGVVWSRSLWQSRLFLSGLVALSPVVGWLWQDLIHLDRPAFSLRRFTTMLIGLALLFNLAELSLSFIQTNPLTYLIGSQSRADYLTQRSGAYYVAMEDMNQTLPASAKVLLLWEPRSYYCQIDCRPDSILDQLAHDQHLYGNAVQIAAAWRKAGITHILLHRQGLQFIQNEDPPLPSQPAIEQLARLEADYLEPVFDVAGAYQLYKLKNEK